MSRCSIINCYLLSLFIVPVFSINAERIYFKITEKKKLTVFFLGQFIIPHLLSSICCFCFIYEVVSEYAKRILACTENTLNEYTGKRSRRIRQEYFAVLGECADRHKIEPISTNFRPKQKIQIVNHLPKHDRMGKKPSRATVPLRPNTNRHIHQSDR